MKNTTNKIFIYAFLFLYALVAFISFCHAIEFFDIGNVHWMSIMLAFAFELGLAVCLASILIGTNKRNNVAWLLLIILVLVQVIGNTYSVFKFISESGKEYYNYLAKPMLFMIEEVSQEAVQIIISWIMGAILPVVALLMTEMVANGIKETQSIDNESHESIDLSKNDEDNANIKNDINVKSNHIDVATDENLEQNEDITPFENKSMIDSEDTTVNNDECLNDNSHIEREYNQESHKDKNDEEIITMSDREPKQMFDELKKESLNI